MSEREQEAVLRAARTLLFIAENLEKRQYLNALAWLNRAEKATLEALDAVLKGE